MAWVGEIVEFESENHGWRIVVAYYNTESPEQRILRTLKMLESTTKAQAVKVIQDRGAEVRAQARLADERLVGQIVSIP
jgi:hypothetical protein